MTGVVFWLYSHRIRLDRGEGGGEVAQSVERTTSSEEVLGSIPALAARSLLLGSLST